MRLARWQADRIGMCYLWTINHGGSEWKVEELDWRGMPAGCASDQPVIVRLGKACFKCFIPLSVTRVPERLSSESFPSPLRSTRPASVTRVSLTSKRSRLVIRFKCAESRVGDMRKADVQFREVGQPIHVSQAPISYSRGLKAEFPQVS